jgi:dUTP pyrophosphatase
VAGIVIMVNQDMIIPPAERSPVNTGIALAVPQGTYVRIAPRSGLAVKHGIDIGAGVIDEDYQGEIKVVLINNSSIPFQVRPGDRIAQLI